jgi:hypothetical protein
MLRKRKDQDLTDIELDAESLKPIIESETEDDSDSTMSMIIEENPIKRKCCCLVWWLLIILVVSLSVIFVAICILYSNDNIKFTYKNGTKVVIDIEIQSFNNTL